VSAPSRSSRGPRIGALGIGICRGLDRAALVSEARVPALHPPHQSPDWNAATSGRPDVSRAHASCTAVPVKSGSTPRPPGSSGPGASMAHVKKVLGHVSERMSESYVLIAGTQVEPTSPESPTACIGGGGEGTDWVCQQLSVRFSSAERIVV